jgi:hypothetical protein
MVRDLYGEVPPAPQLEDEIRGRLAVLGMERGDGRATVRRRTVPRGRAAFGLGLVAVAAATVVGVATLGSTSPAGSRHPALARPVELSARSILLTAADKAAAEPMGRYWMVHMRGGQSYHAGPAIGGYTVVGYSTEESSWTARSEADTDVFYARDLGARPLTAADKAAWKKAGSPSTWKVWSNDHYATLSTKPGATFGAGPGTWVSDETTPAQKRKNAAQTEEMCKKVAKACEKVEFNALSWADRQKLASDPIRFKELLFPDRPGTVKMALLGPATQLMEAYGFLTTQPASPQVRAAAFRLVAGLPGIRSIGEVQDADGRTGVGLAARATMRDGSGTIFDEVLILDPKTYKVLGDQRVVVKAGGSDRGMKPGTILYQDVVLQAGWTNANPHHP